MPTYAYACTACDHQFEVQQSFTDKSLDQCPQCDGRLRKLFNAVGIVFKGSGFYRTDSRTSTGSDQGSSDSSTPASSKDTATAGSGASNSSSSTPAGSNGSSTAPGSKGSSGSGGSSRSSTSATSTSAA